MGSVMVILHRKMYDYENTWGGSGGTEGKLCPIYVQFQFLIFICLFVT